MKILIIRLSSLGDIILTQPVCAILRNKYPQAEIHFVCKPEYASLPVRFGLDLKVLEYRKELAFHRQLSQTRYDLAIDLQGKFSSFLLMAFCRAKSKITYQKQRALRQAIAKGKSDLAINSTVDLYMSALNKLGITEPWSYPVLHPEQPPASKETEQHKIACFPGATHYTKRWLPEYWTQLINSFPTSQFTLYGSSGEKTLCDGITAGTNGNCQNLAGKLGFSELLSSLQNYDLVLSGDTGPMHLAAALGKPQIAIFGGTDVRLGFRPLNDQAVVLSAGLKCQPCSLHGLPGCPLGHFNCMRKLTPEQVGKLLTDLLSK